MGIIVNWIVTTLAIIISAYLLSGIQVRNFVTALIAAAVLGFINAIIKPIFVILTLPITILTLGLFLLVINALLVMLTSAIVPGFAVKNFWWALLFSLVFSAVSYILHKVFPG